MSSRLPEVTWEANLLELAGKLREQDRSRCLALLPLAERLGAAVELQSCSSKRFHASTVVDARPARIVVYRQSSSPFRRMLHREEDHVLTARERFSVAHELGHWLALDRFGVKPETGRSR